MKRIAIWKILQTYKQTGSYTKTAEELEISRWTVRRWVLRAGKVQGRIRVLKVHRKSTRPHHIHRKLTGIDEQTILKYKKYHYGAGKIKVMGKIEASVSTIQRFLEEKGEVKKQGYHRRPQFQNGKVMRPSNTHEFGYLQMDTKHVTPELSGLPETIYEYAAIDIYSRYKTAILLPRISDETAVLALQLFLEWMPFPVKYVQTDNGLEFQYKFHTFCTEKQINHFFIHKHAPNENAVIERSFKTDEDEFYLWIEKEPQHIAELNQWFEEYLKRYNTIRPHYSLNYQSPLQFIQLVQMS